MLESHLKFKWLQLDLNLEPLSSDHLNFRFPACFEQGVLWHSGNYRVWIHSETFMWHDNNIQSWVSCFINAITVTITVIVQDWRWLIYALCNFLLCNNMLHVFRSNHHCSWKFHRFHRKKPVLEFLFEMVAGLQAYFVFVFLYNLFLMTSFAYIFPCPFTLFNLLSTVSLLRMSK